MPHTIFHLLDLGIDDLELGLAAPGTFLKSLRPVISVFVFVIDFVKRTLGALGVEGGFSGRE